MLKLNHNTLSITNFTIHFHTGQMHVLSSEGEDLTKERKLSSRALLWFFLSGRAWGDWVAAEPATGANGLRAVPEGELEITCVSRGPSILL